MKNQKTNIAAVLASYATLKTLFDAGRYQSVYQILQEFIKYIIIKDALVLMEKYIKKSQWIS